MAAKGWISVQRKLHVKSMLHKTKPTIENQH